MTSAARRDAASAFAGAFTAPWTVFWVAFVLRVAYVTVAHTYRFRPYEDHFQFGWEMTRIARALVTGYGYADPFNGHTGPTTWVTPLYPLFLAGVFKVFGIYTLKSAWVILTVNSFFSALMTRTTWEIAARCFTRRVAVWSAWIWALYPAAMQFAVRWVWEMTVTAFLFSWVLVLALRMRNVGGEEAEKDGAMSVKRWALFGLLWGLITLSSASLAIFLPFCGVWILLGAKDWKRQLPGVVVAALLCAACIAPWIYRNWLAFHQFVPMRGNFGAEFWMGNNPQSVAMVLGSPVALPEEMRLYRQMGELAYARQRGRQAMAYIRRDPRHFLFLCVTRVYYFWAGVPHADSAKWWVEVGRNFNFQFASVTGFLGLLLAVRRRVPAAWLFAMAFAVIPFVYYFVFVQARFRHPLEPLIVILAVYLFQSAEKSWRVGGRGTSGIAATG